MTSEAPGELAPVPSSRCRHCQGMLIVDHGSDECVCFTCSRRFLIDGSATVKDWEEPSRKGERIAGMKF